MAIEIETLSASISVDTQRHATPRHATRSGNGNKPLYFRQMKDEMNKLQQTWLDIDIFSA